MFKVKIWQSDMDKFIKLISKYSALGLSWKKYDNFSFWIKLYLDAIREHEDNTRRVELKDDSEYKERSINKFILEFGEEYGPDPQTIRKHYKQEVQIPPDENSSVKEDTFRKFITAFGENPNLEFPPLSLDKENINETINEYFKEVLFFNEEDMDDSDEDSDQAESTNEIDEIKNKFCNYEIFDCYMIIKYFNIFSTSDTDGWDFFWYYNNLENNDRKQLKKLLSQIQIPITDLNSIIENTRIKTYRDIKDCLAKRKDRVWLWDAINKCGYKGNNDPPNIIEFLWSKFSNELYGGVETLDDLMDRLATINFADLDILIAFEASPQKKQLLYIAKGLYEEKAGMLMIGGQSAIGKDNEVRLNYL